MAFPMEISNFNTLIGVHEMHGQMQPSKNNKYREPASLYGSSMHVATL